MLTRTPLRRTPLKRKTRLRSRGLRPIPPEVRRIVVERDGGLCVLTGQPYEDIAHVWQSRGAGGPMEPWNLACMTHEAHMRSHHDPEYRRKLLAEMERRGIVPPKGAKVKWTVTASATGAIANR